MEELHKIYTYGRYLRNKFGQKVYKIPLSLTGFTCPNLDGTKAKGGCSYCDNDSFSPNLSRKKERFTLSNQSSYNPFLLQQLDEITTQYSMTHRKLTKKFQAHQFIAYFQSFTNTYAPNETLFTLWHHALQQSGCIGLSIGTRADCLNDEILDYLAFLSKDYEIWIELGIQSVFNETLTLINRAEDFNESMIWIKKAKLLGINICAHIIYGLPNETVEMMQYSYKTICDLEVNSLKIHPLYVVKNTLLANEYRLNKFTPISYECYMNLLIESLINLPQGVSIQRVSAGIDDETLMTPQWCRSKHTFMKDLRCRLKKKGWSY